MKVSISIRKTTKKEKIESLVAVSILILGIWFIKWLNK